MTVYQQKKTAEAKTVNEVTAMVIDKIGNIGKIFQNERPKNIQAKQAPASLGEDTVSISKEALKAQEMAQTTKIVKSSADVRQDRIREVKEKLERGDYDNLDNELLDRVADRIAGSIIR